MILQVSVLPCLVVGYPPDVFGWSLCMGGRGPGWGGFDKGRMVGTDGTLRSAPNYGSINYVGNRRRTGRLSTR